jgi:F-type H+-transporting ATPase subunit b
MSIFYDSNIVVAISFVLFFLILGYYGVHKLILEQLDKRAERIRGELDEARRLREEAQATFAEFERKQKEVAAQAEDIVEHARTEARESAERAKAEVAESIARRLRAADEQIAMAEANAVKEVRNKAVNVAVAAASQVIAERMGDDKASELIDGAIETVGKRLH